MHLMNSFAFKGKFLFQVDNEMMPMENGDRLFILGNVKHRITYSGETSGTLLANILSGKWKIILLQ
jgi:hypothetical protein